MSLSARLLLVAVLAASTVLALAACSGDDQDITTSSDLDGDTVANDADNCVLAPNPSQSDLDADGFGDACDCDVLEQVCLNEGTTYGGCADGIDNDGDGRADAADPNCDVESRLRDNCGDGVDNDGDLLKDCIEPACAGAPGCPGGP